LFIRCEDIDTNIKDEIRKILGNETNEEEYNQWLGTKRIVILLDGFDEISVNSINNYSNSSQIVQPKQINITFVISTQRHKTAAIAGGNEHINWTVYRCNGIKEHNVVPFVHSRICCNESECTTNEDKVKGICDSLKENNLNHIPLFISLASKLFRDDNSTPTDVYVYDMINRFCDEQLSKLDSVNSTQSTQFFNTLGRFAISNGCVKSIKTTDGKDLIFPEETTETDMNINVMYTIGRSTGLLTRDNTGNRHYAFMHKIIAEFAVAHLIHHHKMWKCIDPLAGENAMIYYFIIRRAIHKKNYDADLFNLHLTYSINNMEVSIDRMKAEAESVITNMYK
jgi:hypothetical protein